jgi:hypothetical protein
LIYDNVMMRQFTVNLVTLLWSEGNFKKNR